MFLWMWMWIFLFRSHTHKKMNIYTKHLRAIDLIGFNIIILLLTHSSEWTNNSETLCLMNEQLVIVYSVQCTLPYSYSVYSMESSSNNMKLNAHAFIEAKRMLDFNFPTIVRKWEIDFEMNKYSSSTIYFMYS